MSILRMAQPGKQPKARRTVLYGVHGVGKTTWAAQWPDPLIIPTEDGNADIDCPSLPLLTDTQSVWQAANELATTEHSFGTAILDSADWFEALVDDDMRAENFDCSYGKGVEEVAKRFRILLDELTAVRNRGVHVIVIAHCEIKRFESPEGESYDRYKPKLSKAASEVLQEWADEVLFACYQTFTAAKDEGFGRKRNVGIGEGKRILKTCERPGFVAKNRLRLPPEMEFDFETYSKYLPPIKRPGNVAGVVVDGSSKKGTVN